jgi:hypothetical protein
MRSRVCWERAGRATGSDDTLAARQSEDLIRAFLCSKKYLPQSQVDTMVGQLVEKRDSICCDRLSMNKPDTVGRTFPQAPAYLGEDFSPAKVSDLIMAFEKLQWLELEPWADDDNRSWV